MPVGVALGKDVDPNVRKNIEQLNDYANGRSGSALLGKNYRWTEGPYPTSTSPNSILLQFKQGTNWITVQAIKADGTNALSCSVSYTTATLQAAPTATNTTINYNLKEYDSDNAVLIGANWLFRVPVGKGGLYQLTANASIVTAAVTIAYTVYISAFVNGIEVRRGARFTSNLVAVAAIDTWYPNLATVVKLNAGDTVNFTIFQNSGAGATLEGFAPANHCSITRLNYY